MEKDIIWEEETSGIVEKNMEVLTEKEKEDVFTKLLFGEQATGEIETSRGKFTVKFPKEKDKLAIGRLMCINRGGLPVSSFDVETENRNLICSTLNILVTKAPDWFEEAKKKVKNFSFEEVPDEEFLLELYQKACSFRDKVQKSFDKEGKSKSNGVSTIENMVDNVADDICNGDECKSSS